MNFSFWERDSWFSKIDYTIIGSGITGLSCALRLKELRPEANVLILEKGILPEGASTKNAGFACFGSISEILDDLRTHSEDEVVELVKKRVNGLELLRKNLGDRAIGYQSFGGYELFSPSDEALYAECLQKIPEINELLRPIFHDAVFSEKANQFGFRQIQPKLIYSQFEGQIDTGKMMTALLKKVQVAGVRILNNCKVLKMKPENGRVTIETDKFRLQTDHLLIATNGFASRLGIEEVKPARAQVLITKPLSKLPFEGTFHLDRGYYYFRNVGNRILFGGGRNLDFKTEETDTFGETSVVQEKLKELLKTTILPGHSYEIDYSWSGIMGVGNQKKPVLKKLDENVYCGVRLGGMGIAIGSQVGTDLANLALEYD
ncbi:NAD(P)/FAD-dependent oxidoreductase [Christiangramia flava]|uniref:Oxidoreductase n=1 Tax=Christiangramia flava JLT2011 TaxID=1229726 RepID=A0A1L7I3J8_9FLAO|nr:FAD-dependent oxidoreductase [Christiangramia flava]APU68180.1 Oxidoreductase [Christiangramia flava JLT2011]OSS41033.1 Oxidoreductase [Christiangramia flava JLT2011]